MIDVLFVSDLDYGYNKENGKYDIPSIEWEGVYGRHWESFDSEVERDKALAENSWYNEQPEVKARIIRAEYEEDKHLSKVYTNEFFEYALNENKTVELCDVLSFVSYANERIKFFITKLVCDHNKALMKTRVKPKVATFSLSDVF